MSLFLLAIGLVIEILQVRHTRTMLNPFHSMCNTYWHLFVNMSIQANHRDPNLDQYLSKQKRSPLLIQNLTAIQYTYPSLTISMLRIFLYWMTITLDLIFKPIFTNLDPLLHAWILRILIVIHVTLVLHHLSLLYSYPLLLEVTVVLLAYLLVIFQSIYLNVFLNINNYTQQKFCTSLF